MAKNASATPTNARSLLVFNVAIFNFDDRWDHVFHQIRNSRKQHVIKNIGEDLRSGGEGDTIHGSSSISLFCALVKKSSARPLLRHEAPRRWLPTRGGWR
jgi:hypothetical protein